MARDLKKLNPHWGDETLFQEARHINAALIQVFLFNISFSSLIYVLMQCNDSPILPLLIFNPQLFAAHHVQRIFADGLGQTQPASPRWELSGNSFAKDDNLLVLNFQQVLCSILMATLMVTIPLWTLEQVKDVTSIQNKQTDIQTGIQSKQIFFVHGRLVWYPRLAQPYWFLYQAIITLFWQNQIGRSSFHNSCLQIRTLPSSLHHWTMVNKVLLLLINKTTNLF